MFEGILMCLNVFRGEREREREFAQNCLENHFFFSFLQNEESRGIYIEKMTLQLLAHLQGLLASLLTSAILALSQFDFGCIFEGLLEVRLS